MAIYFRSVIWRNYEDQILKAAITKYGLNQWDRISSLLINKTPKQCKNRWFFWLNPKIKKTQWSYEEDERLIYLSYIFISQWNTIGKFLGRTAENCAMRFEKLLNIKINNFDKSIYIQDIKNPYITVLDHDHQPAKVGNLSNDHDLQNILVEVRARLSNIKGKKAKRKIKSNNVYYENFIQKEISQKSLEFKINYGEKYSADIMQKTYFQKNILTTFNQAFMCKISKKNDVFFKKNNFFVISNQNYEKLRYIINEKKNKIIPNFLHHIKYHKLLYHKIYKSNITQRCFKVIKENACFITGPLKNKNKLGYFKRAYKIKYYNKCNNNIKNIIKIHVVFYHNIPKNFIIGIFDNYFLGFINKTKTSMYYKLNNSTSPFIKTSRCLLNKNLQIQGILNIFQKRRDLVKKPFFEKLSLTFFIEQLLRFFHTVRKIMLNVLLFQCSLGIQNKGFDNSNKNQLLKNSAFVKRTLPYEIAIFKFFKKIFYNNYIKAKKKNYFRFTLNEIFFFSIHRKFYLDFK